MLLELHEGEAGARRVGELHLERREELAKIIVREMGKPFGASVGEVDFAADITARIPEPQTLLIVTAATLGGIPAARAAWRAGAWPTPPWSTLPRITSSTRSGS